MGFVVSGVRASGSPEAGEGRLGFGDERVGSRVKFGRSSVVVRRAPSDEVEG